MSADPDSGVFVATDIFLIGGAGLAHKDSTGAAVVLATENSEKLCTNLTGVKTLIRYPLGRLIGR